MAEARRGIGLLRAMLLALAVGAGGGMLPTRALQPIGTAVAQDEEGDYADESDEYGADESDEYGADESDEYGADESDEYGDDESDEYGDDESDEYGDDASDEYGDDDADNDVDDASDEFAGDDEYTDTSDDDVDGGDEAEEDSGEEDSGDEDSGEEDFGDEDSGEEDFGEEDSGEEDSGEEDWSDDEFVDQLDAEEGNDFGDDDWAGEYEETDDAAEADDAIPVDEETWGEDFEWDVSEVVEVFEDDGGPDADSGDDSVGVGAMPVLSKGSRTRRPSGGQRPSAPKADDDDEDTPYAYGGRPVSALAVPWQAQIFDPNVRPDPNNPRPTWQRSHYCGGALIARDWVLTAAHCIDQNMVDEGFKVRLGASDIARGDGITYRIERIVRHSRYLDKVRGVPHPATPPNMYFDDIALIRIADDGAHKPRNPARIREIPLNRGPLAGGTPVTVTGWGAVGSGDRQTASAALLRVDLRLMDTPVCRQRPGYGPAKIHDRVFCASHPTRSTCRGDSGGPVVLTNGAPVLVGLVSWGKRTCAGDGRPGVYTRIDRYLAWIEQAMKLPPGTNALP